MHLTPTDWHIVELLVRNPKTRDPATASPGRLGPPQYETQTNYLRVYLAQLRKKLEPEPAQPRYFITEARMGYRFDAGRRGEMGSPSQ